MAQLKNRARIKMMSQCIQIKTEQNNPVRFCFLHENVKIFFNPLLLFAKQDDESGVICKSLLRDHDICCCEVMEYIDTQERQYFLF